MTKNKQQTAYNDSSPKKIEVRQIYVFYADIFFLRNFLMDFAVCAGVNFFLHRQKSLFRLCAAAFAASAMGLALILLMREGLPYRLLMHGIVNPCMVGMCFGTKGLRQFVENWAAEYVGFFLLGGILQWTQGIGILGSAWVLWTASGILLFFAVLMRLRMKKEIGSCPIPVELDSGRACIRVQAYPDSGNLLRDPYTGKAVSIISRSCAECLFGEKTGQFRLVPYRALGESGGLLPVLDLDGMRLCDGKKPRLEENVVVGIAEDALFEGKEYDMILHASFVVDASGAREDSSHGAVRK